MTTTQTTQTQTTTRTIRPLNDRVLLKRIEADDRSPGGILYVPQGAKEKPTEGIVVAVGPGKTKEGNPVPVAVDIGDRVLFGKYAGTDVTSGSEEFVLLREDEIFAVIE